MYQDGRGFVPDEVVEATPVFVLGQNPGVEEEHEGRPFVGPTGQVMNDTYLPIAGLRRGVDVSVGNALRCRWQRANNLPPEQVLRAALAHCTKAHLRIPPGTRLVVAQGGLALRALGYEGYKVHDWRGFLVA